MLCARLFAKLNFYLFYFLFNFLWGSIKHANYKVTSGVHSVKLPTWINNNINSKIVRQ